MTVIGKNLNENYFKAFCKGSPEKIKELCNPSTIPLNFEEVLNSYTTKGYRVLGMAAKSINMNCPRCKNLFVKTTVGLLKKIDKRATYFECHYCKTKEEMD